MSSIQQQISKLQSQLDSKRSRSKTPTKKNESMNSKQRRRSKSTKNKGNKSHKTTKFAKDLRDATNPYAHGDHSLDMGKARTAKADIAAELKQYNDRVKALDKQATESKLVVWDMRKRKDDGSFLTYKEFKESLPKPSLLVEALKMKDCQHQWVISDPLHGMVRYCKICNVSFDSLKDTKTNELLTDQYQKLYEMACLEFEMARAAMRAGLRDRPIKMRLTCNMTITATMTSGVVNTVTIGGGNKYLDLAKCSEWSTLTALFDEFKCTGGEVVFVYVDPVPIGAAPTSDALPIMAYEVDANSAASSSLQLTQSSQHKIFDPLATIGAFGATQTALATPASSIRHNFHWHVPRGTVVAANGNTIPGTEWQTVIGTSHYMGVLQFYHVGTVNTATDVGAGFVYFNTEFRCRV